MSAFFKRNEPGSSPLTLQTKSTLRQIVANDDPTIVSMDIYWYPNTQSVLEETIQRHQLGKIASQSLRYSSVSARPPQGTFNVPNFRPCHFFLAMDMINRYGQDIFLSLDFSKLGIRECKTKNDMFKTLRENSTGVFFKGDITKTLSPTTKLSIITNYILNTNDWRVYSYIYANNQQFVSKLWKLLDIHCLKFHHVIELRWDFNTDRNSNYGNNRRSSGIYSYSNDLLTPSLPSAAARVLSNETISLDCCVCMNPLYTEETKLEPNTSYGFTPCRHNGLCETCALNISINLRLCHICRCEIYNYCVIEDK